MTEPRPEHRAHGRCQFRWSVDGDQCANPVTPPTSVGPGDDESHCIAHNRRLSSRTKGS